MSERLELGELISPIKTAAEAVGFTFCRDYPDSDDVWNSRLSFAVAALKSLEHHGSVKQINSKTVLHQLTVTLRLRLTGRCCGYTDSEELWEKVSQLLAALSRLSDPAFNTVTLGELENDTKTKRLVRELTLSCTLCMEEEET